MKLRIHQQPSGRARRQGGYMLYEIIAGIAIASILVGAFYQISTTIAENRRLASTEEGIALISEALYNYRMQEREWPNSMSDLTAYAPNMAVGMINGFGQPYTLTLTAASTDPVAPITISTTLPTEDIAENVMREFYGRGTRSGARISVEVPIPGHEPAREALLARDGTRDMDGDLDMDNHDLEDVDEITTNTITAVNRITASTMSATNINVGGNTVDGTRAGFLNQIAALNCTGDQRVMISGGTASCSALPAPLAPPAPTKLQCSGAKPGSCSGMPSSGCGGEVLKCALSGNGGCHCYCQDTDPDNQCGGKN